MKISCPSCGASFNVKAEALGASGRKVKCGKCAHQWHALPDGGNTPPPDSPIPMETPPAEAQATETSPPEAPPASTPSEFAADFAAEVAKEPQPESPQSEPETDIGAMNPPAIDTGAEPEIDTDPFPKLDIPVAEPDVADETPPTVSESPPTAPEAKPSSSKEKPNPGLGRRLGRRVLVSAGVAAAATTILVGGVIFLQPQITTMIPAAASLYARLGLQSDIPGLGLTIVEPKVGGDQERLEVSGVIRNDTRDSMDIPVMQARLLDGNGAPVSVWQFRAAKPKIAAGESVIYRTEFPNPPAKAERLDITFISKKNAASNAPELARNPAPDKKKSSDAKANSRHDK